MEPIVKNALELAQSIRDRFDGFTLITGSLNLVGDVLGQFQKC